MDDVWVISEKPSFKNFPQTLAEALEDLREKLRKLLLGFNITDDIESILGELSAQIEDGRLTESALVNEHWEMIFCSDIESRQLTQIRKACIALIYVENFFKSENKDSAWPLLCHANYLVGLIEDGVSLSVKAEETLKKSIESKAAREKGGKKTKDKYDKVRTCMVHLLAGRAPAGGWTSQKQAVDIIHDDLQKFVTEASLGLALPDIHTTATNWLSDNAEIKEVYAANAAKQ